MKWVALVADRSFCARGKGFAEESVHTTFQPEFSTLVHGEIQVWLSDVISSFTAKYSDTINYPAIVYKSHLDCTWINTSNSPDEITSIPTRNACSERLLTKRINEQFRTLDFIVHKSTGSVCSSIPKKTESRESWLHF